MLIADSLIVQVRDPVDPAQMYLFTCTVQGRHVFYELPDTYNVGLKSAINAEIGKQHAGAWAHNRLDSDRLTLQAEQMRFALPSGTAVNLYNDWLVVVRDQLITDLDYALQLQPKTRLAVCLLAALYDVSPRIMVSGLIQHGYNRLSIPDFPAMTLYADYQNGRALLAGRKFPRLVD